MFVVHRYANARANFSLLFGLGNRDSGEGSGGSHNLNSRGGKLASIPDPVAEENIEEGPGKSAGGGGGWLLQAAKEGRLSLGRVFGAVTYTAPTSHELSENLQPKVLNIISDQVIDQEVLRQKRTLIATGPPLLPDDPSISQFYEWESAILRFLELLPGYQIGMLECQPNMMEFPTENLRALLTDMN